MHARQSGRGRRGNCRYVACHRDLEPLAHAPVRLVVECYELFGADDAQDHQVHFRSPKRLEQKAKEDLIPLYVTCSPAWSPTIAQDREQLLSILTRQRKGSRLVIAPALTPLRLQIGLHWLQSARRWRYSAKAVICAPLWRLGWSSRAHDHNLRTGTTHVLRAHAAPVYRPHNGHSQTLLRSVPAESGARSDV